MSRAIFPLSMLLAVTVVSCRGIHVEPGATTTSTRTISSFTKLDVANGFEVIVVPDGTEEVKIEAPEGYQRYITAVVQDGTLQIDFDQRINEDDDLPKRATVHTKSLDAITVSGGCRLTATATLHATRLSVQSSGGSRLSLPLAVDNLSCTTSGGSTLTLTGEAGKLADYECSGGSTVHAFELSTGATSIEASGGSTVEIQTTGSLNVEGSGSSRILYRGTPASLASEMSGGARIISSK